MLAGLMIKRVDRAIYIAAKLVLNNRFVDVVKKNNGILLLRIGKR
jgi:hypothetical protein